MGRAQRLVGREQVRALLRTALDAARAGSGRTVLLTGEPGIGKSALLTWLIDQAAPGALIVRGFCWEGDGAPPYWPWTQVLRATGLPASQLGEAGWLLGAGGTQEPDTAAAAADAQFRLCDAVAGVLVGQASAGRPVVVVLDDLQWADEPSLSLLSFLARAVAISPVLVVGAFREGEAAPRLAEFCAQALHVPLAGLSLPEVEALVAAMPGPRPDARTTRQMWERAGGNPFFVRELTQLVQAYGADEAPSRLPASVVEVVRRRLARLSTECARLLDWAAVAGRDIDVDLLVAAGAADGHAAALDLLDAARRAGMVTGADGLRFTHDLYREAVVAGQPAAVNAGINLALGRALQVRSGGAAQISAHLLRAGPEVQAEAVGYSLRAAREATARLGHDDACSHYQRALALLDDADPRSAEILLELAAAHARAGMSDLAMARYRQAAELSRRGAGGAGLARAALGMQALGHRSGAQDTEVLELLREADRRLDAGAEDASLRSRVLAALTRALRHGSYGPPGEDLASIAGHAVRLAEQALELGRAIGEPDAAGVFGTSRSALAPLGAPVDLRVLSDVASDPLWPLFPLLAAWPAAVRGDTAEARTALGDFSVRVIPWKYDLEILAFAGAVFAVVGSADQRHWAYDRLLPYAGRHIIVGGCAAYFGTVDHVLGKLTAALGNQAQPGERTAEAHLRAALEQYERLGAAGFARLAREDLAALAATSATSEFRYVDGLWRLGFAGRQAQLPDAKGLHDIAALLSAPGTEVHVIDLLGIAGPKLGADPVLDELAKMRYKTRLRQLAEQLDAADVRGDETLARRLTAEQQALLGELTRASGLGGRSRRLGDAGERARKTVGARIRDALGKVERVHPDLAVHLRESLRLGTTCSYAPEQPIRWQTR